MTNVQNWKTALSSAKTDYESLKYYKEQKIDAVELSVPYKETDSIDWEPYRKNADAAGMEIWSFHLPFARECNIAVPKESERAATTAYLCRLIDKAAAVGIRKFIIHPSSEPIPDEERPLWMEAAKQSLKELAEHAASYEAVICVEDLPRTCLGHTADEMVELLTADDRLRVCFDVNHLCLEYHSTHKECVEKLGDKIVTVHMSDYDFIDEKHWYCGNGKINWNEVITLLEEVDYNGPFLYEGGFSPSSWDPTIPYGSVEDAHNRHMHIKEYRGQE